MDVSHKVETEEMIMTEKLLENRKKGMAALLLNLLGLLLAIAVMVVGIVLAETGKSPVFGTVMGILGLVGLLLGWIPLVGFLVGLILNILGTVVDVYAVAGVILTLLVYFKIIKE